MTALPPPSGHRSSRHIYSASLLAVVDLVFFFFNWCSSSSTPPIYSSSVGFLLLFPHPQLILINLCCVVLLSKLVNQCEILRYLRESFIHSHHIAAATAAELQLDNSKCLHVFVPPLILSSVTAHLLQHLPWRSGGSCAHSSSTSLPFSLSILHNYPPFSKMLLMEK
ncbi:hypothetical protein QYF36_018815 [Acer negundo]|nr:hypothetical protein QYF36_002438 [Acer negundo]KAK4846541.1 hypothetical protein QYF36_018815 [Acer negundo]